MITKTRFCLDCGDRIIGRVDKKFCSEQCRNNHNNKVRRQTNLQVERVNRILHRNRKILMLVHQEGFIETSLELLMARGFQADYQTQMFQDGNGTTYRFCYDYGYIQKETKLMIVKGWDVFSPGNE